MPRLCRRGMTEFVIFPKKEDVRVIDPEHLVAVSSPCGNGATAISPLLFSRVFIVGTSRGAFQMKKLRKRGPDNPIPTPSKSQTEVHVIESDWQIRDNAS